MRGLITLSVLIFGGWAFYKWKDAKENCVCSNDADTTKNPIQEIKDLFGGDKESQYDLPEIRVEEPMPGGARPMNEPNVPFFTDGDMIEDSLT